MAQVWDLRSMKRTGDVPDAHFMPVRDIDFAHQQQHLVVSAGDDCKLCLWDLRCAEVRMRLPMEFCDQLRWTEVLDRNNSPLSTSLFWISLQHACICHA